MAKELCFDIDCFNSPKTISDSFCDAEQLRIMLMARRDCHVTYGVGFELSRYRFQDFEESANNIENELREHCLKYLPNVLIQKMDIMRSSSKKLLISITLLSTKSDEVKTVFYRLEQSEATSELLLSIINS